MSLKLLSMVNELQKKVEKLERKLEILENYLKSEYDDRESEPQTGPEPVKPVRRGRPPKHG